MPVEGDLLGPYRLLSHVGTGGMGEVWKASDSRLGRVVAVKILPGDSAADLRARFEQEARAASALQHPNIVSVFDVGYRSAPPYIVSEFVDGETLRALFSRGPLPVKRVLDLAAQVADGLAAAHHAGITHRDLKPENIMVDSGGRPKILDFGLAKRSSLVPATVRAEGTTETFISNPGTVLGTANYMSPEQARGLAVDYRSDQFSFGVILYEMLTGRQPFRRDSNPQTMAAIIADEPEPLDRSVPTPLRWVVERCLEKEPGQRYGSTTDLYRDLRRIRDHLADLSGTAAKPPVKKILSPWLLTAAGGLVLGGLTMFLFGQASSEIDPLDLIPFATDVQSEDEPAFSPDGESIAYWRSPNQIWVRALNNPNAILLAENATGGPFWSRDANRICYKRFRQLWCVGAAGGAPKLLLEDAGLGGAFTPDGKAIVFIRPHPERAAELMISSPAGAEPKPVENLRLPRRPSQFYGFSPDGSRLVVQDVQSELWIVPYPSGAPVRIGEGRAFSWMPDSRHAIYSSGAEGYQAIHLIDTQSAARRLLLRGTTQIPGTSMSPDGKRFVFSSGAADWDAIEYNMDGRRVRALMATTSRELYASWSPTEDRFAYVSFAGRYPAIWTRGTDGSNAILLREIDLAQGPVSPTYSRDGRRIAYGAQPELQTVPSAGGQHVTVAKERAPVGELCWSDDDEFIWYIARGQLFKVASQGGEPAVIRQVMGAQLGCAPDGKWIAYPSSDGLHLMTPEGKEDHLLLPGPLPPGRVQFGDGSRILYQMDAERRALITWETGTGRKLREAGLEMQPEEMVARFHVHRDGKRLLLQVGRVPHDLWLAEDFARPAPPWIRWLKHWEIPPRKPPHTREQPQ
jgi:serine/threonine protein kinase